MKYHFILICVFFLACENQGQQQTVEEPQKPAEEAPKNDEIISEETYMELQENEDHNYGIRLDLTETVTTVSGRVLYWEGNLEADEYEAKGTIDKTRFFEVELVPLDENLHPGKFSGQFVDEAIEKGKLFFLIDGKYQLVNEYESIDMMMGDWDIDEHGAVYEYGLGLKTWIDRLNVREKPDLNSKVIEQLKEGQGVMFYGNVSTNKAKVTLRGQAFDEHFLEVETYEKRGWIYAGGVKTDEGDVFDYSEFIND